ncbi:hypothetical protein Clacol_002421 [Clathrus columnatus]|uniref:Beta-lactamase-related domain-containing protein n=1 Tax=Clathrus columnatus TaxID=1419009 RepID=A0AAV5A4V3_9AGAM|nr:hypothetical protein Clacol_002421 [Clathrus columnatus]
MSAVSTPLIRSLLFTNQKPLQSKLHVEVKHNFHFENLELISSSDAEDHGTFCEIEPLGEIYPFIKETKQNGLCRTFGLYSLRVSTCPGTGEFSYSRLHIRAIIDMSDIKAKLQTLIDNAVKDGVAPGLQCVVFNRDEIIFNGVSGFASLPSEKNPAGEPMTKSSVLWLASCSRLVVSLIVLHVLDKGLIDGISIGDLDNPDALAKIVPEFSPESGSLVTKIIEGFENGLGPDGRKIIKLRDAKNRVTLRQLLTHSSGVGFTLTNPLLWELINPSDKSVPLFNRFFDGSIRDFSLPLVFEPGTDYHYGYSTEWLGQFVVRGTGKHLRQLFHEIVFEPLKISPADLWLSPELSAHKAEMHVRNKDSPYKFQKIIFDIYSAEDGPGEGMAYIAGAGLNASLQAYAQILQAVVNRDPKIMSPTTWELALKDDFGPRGVKVTRPDFKSMRNEMTYDVVEFAKTNSENGTGMNLLQCKVALVPTLSGRPVGSFGWGGLPNIYYSVDPATGLGSVVGTQMFPFSDPDMIELRDQIERYEYVGDKYGIEHSESTWELIYISSRSK